MKDGEIIERGVRRVVWIPQKLDQEIEDLRHNIGYTRSGFYRYALTRLIEQLILTKQKELHLQPWQEIIGTLKELKTDGETTTAILTCTHNTDYSISYPNGTKEAETLQTLKNLQGEKIVILKTDLPEKPLLIQCLERNDGSQKNFFMATTISLKLVLVLTRSLFVKMGVI
jgi:hypothetical protein